MKNDVLEYIGLDLENIPQILIKDEPIHFNDFGNANIYKVYDYVSVHDIEILITPLDRTADIRERYKTAKPLSAYLMAEDRKLKDIFKEVLEFASVTEIKKLEELQEKLKEIPYFVKYDKNYLWQVYYSKEDNKYFMLFPANEGETSVLFYIIKKKLEKEDTKIFIPINKMDYRGTFLTSMQINDIENYIWLFTNEWPNIYEVSGKYLYITGHTKVKKMFNTYYRNAFENKKEAEKFYMLLKALFILTTETNYKYNFEPYVNENGNLELVYENSIITVQNLAEFVDKQVEIQKLRKTNLETEKVANEEILKELKEYVKKQNDIYVMQEKQIVMFLDCKKSFFKKLSYFFKTKKFVMPKLDNKLDKRLEDKILEKDVNKEQDIKLNGSYTIKELISAFNSANEAEIKAREVRLDIRALKLKKENYTRKIENAKKYIEEIESHKKSIFEFWKFSNKDELPALSEGDSIRKDEKKSNNIIDKDFIGVKADSLQRQKLSDEEINALYLFFAMPEIFNHISKAYDKNQNEIDKATEKNIFYEEILERLKKKTSKLSLDNLINDYTTVKKINSKEHRENERSEISILKINENTTVEELKDRITHFKKLLESAYNKIYAVTNMTVYIKKSDAKNEFILGDINPENLIKGEESSTKGENTDFNKKEGYSNQKSNKIVELIKVNLSNKEHALYLTNIVFFDNQNKTLPMGMDLSSKVVINKINLNSKKDSDLKIDEKTTIVLHKLEKINDFAVNNITIKIL